MNLMKRHQDKIYYEGSGNNPLPMYGIAVDSGWMPLVDTLADKIAEIDIDNKVRFVQIKEKFGGLRFYTQFVNLNIKENAKDKELWDAVCKLISEAETQSYITCEVCGQMGKLRNKFRWMKTLCDDHTEEYRKTRSLK